MNVFYKWQKTGARGSNVWLGPCGDSFCYASCDLPVCKHQERLGRTPDEHNQECDKLHRARADVIIELYDLSQGSELADDVLHLFQRLKSKEDSGV